MFRTLLDHLQEALHNGTWYIACVLCQLAASGLEWTLLQSIFRHFFKKITKMFSAFKFSLSVP
jgi:hypothetical protein